MVDTRIPAVLKADAQWICWRTEARDGESTKVPIDPATGRYASVSDPATWTDYATARAYWQNTDDVEGLGFVFTADDPYTGVDLDDCRDPETGEVEAWAAEVIRELNSYTERSPSGTGFHVYVVGDVPAGGNRGKNIEVYDRDRYFTVTSDRVPGAPRTVEERADELEAVHREYIAETTAEAVESVAPVAPAESTDHDLSDEVLLEKAMTAANGEKFQRLWNGDISGYPSHSEADQALCNVLAFWTGGDPQRIEHLFSRSGLVRAKWRNREDYRERTIRTAIEDCSAFYDPDVAEE